MGRAVRLRRNRKDGRLDRRSFLLFLHDEIRKLHTLVCGATRSGKTRVLMADVVRAILRKWNVIVLDPKGDQYMFRAMVEAALRSGRLRDLMLIDLADPEISVKFNPFSDYFHLQEIAEHLVAAIKQGKEPFFREQAYKTALFALETHDYLAARSGAGPTRYTISTLKEICSYDWIKKHIEVLEDLAAFDPKAGDLLLTGRSLSELNRRKFEEVVSSLSNVLVRVGEGVVREIIDSADPNPVFERLWNDQGVILYVFTGAMVTQEGAEMLSRLILSALRSLVGRVYRFKKQRSEEEGKFLRPLMMVIDEAQNAIFPGFELFLDKAGGVDVYFTLAVQTPANFVEALGETKARVILGNLGLQVFLQSPDPKFTGLYVAAKAGQEISPETYLFIGRDGGTLRERKVDVLDAGAVGRLRPRQFIALVPKDKFSPPEPFTGDVRFVPDPSIKLVGFESLEEAIRRRRMLAVKRVLRRMARPFQGKKNSETTNVPSVDPVILAGVPPSEKTCTSSAVSG